MSDSIGLEYPVPERVRLGEKDGQRALIYVFGPVEKRHRAQLKTLEGFRRLADADEQAILKFSQLHGVLTGSAEIQSRLPNRTFPQIDEFYKLRYGNVEGELCEPLDAWRRHARQADAILRIAHAINVRAEPRDCDWKVLYASVPSGVKTRRKDGERRLLVEAVNNQWLFLTDIRPILRWDVSVFELTFRLRNLFDALGWLLLEAIAGYRVRICVGCGEPYLPSRKHRKYCPKCPGAANRLASRKYDEKKRARVPRSST